ncbi:hypothetical protein TIFTF001_011003 [Ficus carica]|uniref:Galactose oxidase n=1 Tax=Ficus carica TaxID=3494 RepID=A0AA88A9M4_FICCA|nr:hypothetical protein TIFTF001_011003 [Ficus carica]
MASKKPPFFFFFFFFHLTLILSLFTTLSSSDFDVEDYNRPPGSSSNSNNNSVDGGHWILLHSSIGVSAMHMQLLRNGKVVIFDGIEVGPSNLTLPDRQCLRLVLSATTNRGVVTDCTAHSVLYDVASNTFCPLTLRTNTWCSSGSVDPDGTLVQTGGYGDGIRKIRTFSPTCQETDAVSDGSSSSCDWTELSSTTLAAHRWYSSNQVLPDGRLIIVGGRQSFSYEFFPKNSRNDRSFYLRFLFETMDPYEENNLYPFLHLLPDGNLFIFANNRSISFDYNQNKVVREFPVIPGGYKRSYPSTGSSVLLPLKLTAGVTVPEAEVMICGGSPPGAFNMSNKARVFLPAARSCGRLRVTDLDPKWKIENMPMPRVMPDMLLLPTGDVIIINGAGNGTAGWNDAVNPVLNPVLYRSGRPYGRRFMVLNPTAIARMYHSSAVLLPSGGILVGGSNPHRKYNFTADPFPTELSLEVYEPYYLDTQYASMRPSILTVETSMQIVSYGQMFSVTFVLPLYMPNPGVSVALVAPSFSTHSFAMNQRVVVLEVAGLERLSVVAYKITARGPPTSAVAPPGFYMLFLVHSGVPSEGVWLKIQ